MTDTKLDVDASREYCLADPPPDLPMFAENLLVSGYDPGAKLGLWLHLGTWPEDFSLWEDMVLLALPDDGDVLWMTGYHRPPPAERPAGSLLSFRCLEPFRRWEVRFDGTLVRTPHAELIAGRARDSHRERVRLELQLQPAGPVWDGHISASSDRGRGSMSEQVWASDHYQQLMHMIGAVDIAGRRLELRTTAVRDHSRGQRGHAMDRWGGHTLIHVGFPSGRAVGVQRMWSPDGIINFDTAYVLVDGEQLHAEVIEAPRLKELSIGGRLSLRLRSDLGEHNLHGAIVSTVPLTPQRLGLAVGADLDGPYGVFAVGHGRWEWYGEEAYGLTERSDRIGAATPDLQ